MSRPMRGQEVLFHFSINNAIISSSNFNGEVRHVTTDEGAGSFR